MLSKSFSHLLNGRNSLLLFLGVRFIVLALYIIYLGPTLSPDEAQYWTWSQDLSLGYYSKPPGIAWQIFSTSSLFGNNEFGVRASALILGTFTCMAIYWLAKEVFKDEKTAFWSAVTFAITPMSLMGSVLAITDGGMILCWLLALGFFLRSNFVLFGILIGLGALFKWPIYILPVGLLICRPGQWKDILKGVAISLFGFIPALVWNIQHDFVTFRHVGATLQGGHYGTNSNVLDFLGAQIGLLSPLFFLFALLSFTNRSSEKNEKLLKGLTAIFIVPLCMSLFMKMQGNWADYVLPTAHILGIHWVLSKKNAYFWISLASLLSLLIGVVLGANILPYHMNPLKNALGYDSLTTLLKEQGYDPAKEYLVSDSYQVTSLLSFYGPVQDRAYFLNVSHRRLNQFSFWTPLKEDPRKEGFFVVTADVKKMAPHLAEDLQKRIEPYFAKVSFVGAFPLYVQKGQAQKSALLYHVEGYTKEEPGHGGLF